MTKLLRTSALTALTTLVLALAACGPEIDDVADGSTGGSDVEVDEELPIAAPDRGEIDDDLEDISVGPRPVNPASADAGLALAARDDGPCDTWGPGLDDLEIGDGVDGQGAQAGELPLADLADDSEDTSGHDGELDLAGGEPWAAPAIDDLAYVDDEDASAPEHGDPWYADRPDEPGDTDGDDELDIAVGA